MVFEPVRAPPRKHLPPGERRSAGTGKARGRKPLGRVRRLQEILRRDKERGCAARELGRAFCAHRTGSNSLRALGEGDPSGGRTKTQSPVLAKARLQRPLARNALLTY